MAAYNINGRCESCTFADSYGRACKHGLLFPVLVMMSFGNMWKCPNFQQKTKEQLEEQCFEKLTRINAIKNGRCWQCKHFHQHKGKRNTCSKDPFSFDNGWEYVPYSYKAKARACSEFEYREDLIWMQNKIINK